MRVLVEILRWKDENLKHENIQHFGFFLSKVATYGTGRGTQRIEIECEEEGV